MYAIDVVSHCYAGHCPHYAWALEMQIQSLEREAIQGGVDLTLWVCHSPKDKLTVNAMEHVSIECLKLRRGELPIEYLGRRAIGRHEVAVRTKADFVWFSDVDQVFVDGVFSRLVEWDWPEDVTMVYPKEIQIHRTHKLGDKRLAERRFDRADFVPKRYNRAIGGAQIVRGDFARRYGYLGNSPRWTKPTSGGFASCKCDIAYRKHCREHGRIVGIDLPGVYRLRHSVNGRDVK
jgi:hypothetical protein